MKIGIDCRLWNETGVGRYIRNLVKELAKTDTKNEYVLFVLGKDKENVKFQISNVKFQIVTTDVHWHTVEEQVQFPKILNKENVDLVHFPYFSVPLFYNRPFVITIHDLILHNFPTGKASTLPPLIYQGKLLSYKFVLSQAAKKALKIITVSHATEEEIVKKLHVSKDKIVVTYEGVDQQIAHGKRQIEKNHTLSAISHMQYFLYVGNAYPHKNLEKAIEAFGKVRESHANVQLILVGKEDYFYKKLKRKVQDLGLSEHVLFYQKVNDEELSDLYQHAIALVAPSLMEGFSLPPLEALANGCLVVASEIAAHKEICKDVPLYFDPNDANSLESTLQRAISLSEKERMERRKQGKTLASSYSWETMAKETLGVYTAACEREQV